jgi:Carbohydrate binding module (family 6)
MRWLRSALEQLRRGWRQQAAPRRATLAGLTALLALLIWSLAALGLGTAGASALPVGADIPTDDLAVIVTAAKSCPAVTPPRLAAQLMANSGFDPNFVHDGRSGLAGLTDDEWQRWAPRPGAVRTSAADNITALAHEMCDLVGALRARQLAEDPWRLALAAFTVGTDPVVAASAVPAGPPAEYVQLVDGYVTWYQQQPQLGGSGPAATPSGTATWPPPTAVPAALAPTILAAGSTCPAVSPARIAATLMARSAFNSDQVGPAGEQGVAQFSTGLWSHYNQAAGATPWDNTAAITALGRALCDLAGQATALAPTIDPLPAALSAFAAGTASVAGVAGSAGNQDGALVVQVQAYIPYYASDARLRTAAATPTPTPSTASPAARTSASAVPAAALNARTTAAAPPGRDAYSRIEAESYATQSGAEFEDCFDTGGGRDAGHLASGDWLRYASVDFGSSPANGFSVRYASDVPTGMTATIEVRLDSPTATPAGAATVTSTGGWQTWVTVPATTTPLTGRHDVYLTFTSSNGWEIGNINWIQFNH